MGGLISEDVKERVRAAADIVDVVKEYVPLKKMGRNYFGLCPFHSEDSPSFSVSAEKQIFYCFGCNAGGDVFRFLMLKDGISFPEAVQRLADRAGIVVPREEKSPEVRRKEAKRQEFFEANELAMKYYHWFLNQEAGAQGRQYLVNRGLSPEIIEQFQLGYAPQGWDNLLRFMLKRGRREKDLAALGLLAAHTRESKATGYYDQFRNRVMFPIWNHYNRVVGFGGRVLDTSLPKYLNSPESDIFNKSRTLYGLNFAANSIRDLNQAIIMEGYLDVITCHQYGITNAVAALGTALTAEHAKLLMRYTGNLVMAFDADSAGIKATLRGLDLVQSLGCQVRVVAIPDGKDPDEYLHKFGADAFKRLITEDSHSLVQFKMLQAAARYDLTTVTGKTSALAEVLPNLAKVRSEVEREEYLRVLGQELNLSWDTILGELRKFQREQQKTGRFRDKNVKNRNNSGDVRLAAAGKAPVKLDGLQRAEYTLLRLILENRRNLDYVEEHLGLAEIRDPAVRRLIGLYSQQVAAREDFLPAELFPLLPEEGISAVLSRVLMLEVPLDNIQETLDGCLSVIRSAGSDDRKGRLLRELAEAEKVGDWQLVATLMEEYKQLLK